MIINLEKGKDRWAVLKAGDSLTVRQGNLWLVDHRSRDCLLQAGESWSAKRSQAYLLTTFVPVTAILRTGAEEEVDHSR
jgi:hypothetical protein